ncbi:hypothetical protein LXA43DRAFT_1082947 [Ganoderma leucocontextum]|nr:hypothetical protein LXA43DRAFT_1082947 [Ganoderma leucocontextum]
MLYFPHPNRRCGCSLSAMSLSADASESSHATTSSSRVVAENEVQVTSISRSSNADRQGLRERTVVRPRREKTLVLCFDGTGNEPGTGFDSNVATFFRLLQRGIPHLQNSEYHAGIGTQPVDLTSSSPSEDGHHHPWQAFVARFRRIRDKVFATYLSQYIQECYYWVMENYEPGDKICLFGFSRGAYVVRALAGMLHKIGLLSKGSSGSQQINITTAYNLYVQEPVDNDWHARYRNFQRSRNPTFNLNRNINIYFIEVWDTVASIGAIQHPTLPFIYSNPKVQFFRHALALDEHHASFQPEYFKWPPGASAQTN